MGTFVVRECQGFLTPCTDCGDIFRAPCPIHGQHLEKCVFTPKLSKYICWPKFWVSATDCRWKRLLCMSRAKEDSRIEMHLKRITWEYILFPLTRWTIWFRIDICSSFRGTRPKHFFSLDFHLYACSRLHIYGSGENRGWGICAWKYNFTETPKHLKLGARPPSLPVPPSTIFGADNVSSGQTQRVHPSLLP